MHTYCYINYHAKFQNFLNASPLSYEMLKEAVWRDWHINLPIDFYFSGINSLPEKCRKCTELSRDYVE